MILKILGCGTSTGVPMPGCKCEVCLSENPRNHRSRSSALLQVRDGFNILIDTTTDFRYQAINNKIDSVDAILFTHAHADHIYGLDDIRSFNFIQKKTVPCYANQFTISEIKRAFAYIFDPRPEYEGGIVPQITMNEINDYENFMINNVAIQAFNLKHGRLTVNGFRFGDLAYATDCNFIPDKSMEILKGLKTLVIDALRFEEHKTHFTISQAIEIAKNIGAERTYLTHMSHAVEYEEVSKSLPKNIFLAYDGLELPLSY